MKNEVRVQKKTKLTKGQTSLYLMILEKEKTMKPITYSEAKELYIRTAAREVRNGWPHWFNFWWKDEKGERVGRWQPLTEYEVAMRSMMWLTHNIGALVLKGCLKVVPQIEVDEIKALV